MRSRNGTIIRIHFFWILLKLGTWSRWSSRVTERWRRLTCSDPISREPVKRCKHFWQRLKSISKYRLSWNSIESARSSRLIHCWSDARVSFKDAKCWLRSLRMFWGMRPMPKLSGVGSKPCRWVHKKCTPNCYSSFNRKWSLLKSFFQKFILI